MSTEQVTLTSLPPFKNIPLLDFGEAPNRQIFGDALREMEKTIRAGGRLRAHPVIGGEERHGVSGYTRCSPSDAQLAIGPVSFASLVQADEAVAACRAAFPGWRATPHTQRAELLLRLADLLSRERHRLSALLVYEVGKTWREADADTAEAIDFCRYYAREALRLGDPVRTELVPGEDNHYLYQPRGVTVVLAPWNFPLAIACGMAVAALVAGNTVVLKPAEQSSIIASELCALAYAAGFPPQTLSFLPARGEDVGRHLVAHPDVAMIVFTGSREVGLEIISSAAQVRPGQRTIKRVVAELGGKNAIIIDDDADVSDAVRGVISSAFGYAGQKCSACSRLIVVGALYEPFLERLAATTRELLVGPASDPASFLGPVIDAASQERIKTVIETARRTLTVLAECPVPAEVAQRGHFVSPTVFRDVPADHPLWKDEIFGPVLACARARSFEEALSMAVDSEFALTGGVYSRHPQHLELARTEFRVGNLYINRGITGALVGRQPFGGFKLSGIGSKAGGPDYLIQFMEPRVITENTMRRGFAPELP